MSEAHAPVKLEAVLHGSWAQLVQRFADCRQTPKNAATIFQSGAWLQAWYDTLGAQPGTKPLPLEIRDANSGEPLLGIPLVKRVVDSLDVVEFADSGLTDYNAPLLGALSQIGANPAALVTSDALLDVLKEQLGDYDQLRFVKMPGTLSGVANPFTQLPGSSASELGSNVVSIEGSWADYRKRLAKKVRKELERSFRVFQRDGVNARFEVVEDPIEAIAVLEQMEALQAERMRELGLPFVLNEPQYSAFYRRLIELDLASGRLLLTVLRSEPDELVGALLGLVDGPNYAMVRLAHAGKAWSHCSPGKLIIDQTMQHLHAKSINRFDFTTGDYTYKKGFLTASEPLVEVSLGLSLRGRLKLALASTATAIKEGLRSFPRTYALFKRLGEH